MVCEAPGILPFSLTNQIRERDQMRGAWDSGSVPIFVRFTFILLRGAAVSLTFGIFVTCNRGRRCTVLHKQGQSNSIDFSTDIFLAEMLLLLSTLLHWSVSRGNVTYAFADLSYAAIIGRDHSLVPIICIGLQAAQEKARI